MNSRLDATKIIFNANYNQLNMFRAIISTILRSTRLPAGSTAGALYHILVLLRMVEIMARNMLS